MHIPRPLLAVVLLATLYVAWPVVADDVFTTGGHDQITCTTSGVLISITGSSPREITISNPTSTIARVYSQNGQAAAEGTPLCTASTCVGVSLRLPSGNGVFKCATDAGTQAVYLLGGR